MAKKLFILNLLLALVLLPVAQAFANPIDINPPADIGQMDMSHCKNMNNGVCGDKSACLASGMVCIDSLSTALLEYSDLSITLEKNPSFDKLSTDYIYLSVYSILRPPRNFN